MHSPQPRYTPLASLSAAQRTWADSGRADSRRVAWLSWCQARIRREAVAAIERDGGLVTDESNRMTKPRHRYGKPHSTNWLVNAIGVDYFERVVEVADPLPLLDTPTKFLSRSGAPRVGLLVDRLPESHRRRHGSVKWTDEALLPKRARIPNFRQWAGASGGTHRTLESLPSRRLESPMPGSCI